MSLFRRIVNTSFIFFIYLLPLFLFSEPIPIDEDFQFQEVGMNLEYLEDVSGNVDFPLVQKSPDWKVWTKKNLQFSFTRSAYWIRFTITNNSDKEIPLIFDTGFSRQDRIEFYYPGNNRSYSKVITGDTFPYYSRQVDHVDFSFKVIPSPKSNSVYYMKVSAKYNILNMIPSLQNEDYFSKKIKDFLFLNGIFLGFLIIMFLYNIFLSIILLDKGYLYLGLFIFVYLAYISGLYGLAFRYIYPDNVWIQNHDIYFYIPQFIVFGLLFVNNFFHFRYNYFTFYKVTNIIIVFFFLLSILLPVLLVENFSSFSFYFVSYSVLIFLLYVLFITIYLSIKRVREAYFYLASWSIMVILSIGRILASMGLASDAVFSNLSIQIGLSITLILLSLGLADRVNRLKKSLETANESLEAKVLERTNELNKTLTEVNILKTKQDGDYFLTSLLVEPLGSNDVFSKKFKVEFFVKQKKEFCYKNWKKDIGGDICIAKNIFLGDRKFSVFVNADAMGKSIQGAAGILIFGSVFGAILNRVSEKKENTIISPENWIRETFIELNKVFEVFDFSMLVSIFIGVVDEETNMLYYLSADHPFAVIYRDGKAKFLHDSISTAKLGMLDKKNVYNFTIQTFLLKEGDILLVGSDGKDDIVRKVNGAISYYTEEGAFLKHVEKARGDLGEIYNSIKETGELIDDFSILKVSYLYSN